MTWWADYRDAWMSLTTLGTAAPWDEVKGKPRTYSDGYRSFRERDIAGNFSEVEEALWALRRGLS